MLMLGSDRIGDISALTLLKIRLKAEFVGFRSLSDYITYTWVKDDQVAFNNELIQVYVSKEEIPVVGGKCVLCYYSSNLQCIVGISEPFQVHESQAAIEEGFLLENVNSFTMSPEISPHWPTTVPKSTDVSHERAKNATTFTSGLSHNLSRSSREQPHLDQYYARIPKTEPEI
ncbi:inositol polyphosphate 5-phosphatase Ka isoform X1 [Tachysurus ichikawai]